MDPNRVALITLICSVVTVICSVFAAAVTVWGVYVAVRALREYKITNRLSRKGLLHQKEQEIFAHVTGKEYLKAFFAYQNNQLSAKEVADAQLNLIMHEKAPLPKWKTIQELDELIYSADGFFDPGKERLREGYYLAESMLYVVWESYNARVEGVLKPEDVSTFMAWVENNGSHPLFLLAVYFWHHCAYFSPAFAVELQARLKASPAAKALIEEVYPELFSRDWSDQIGRDRLYFQGCANQPRP